MKWIYSLLIGALLVIGPAARADESRPNILFIMVDDLRTSLGCYGDPLAKTPHIDRLAATALRFDRAYTQQAVCGPSRTALLTGRLPDHTQVWHNRNRFRTKHPDLITLPQLFKNHGYEAVSLGKVFSGDERELDPISWSGPERLKAKGWKNDTPDRRKNEAGKGVAFEAADVADDAYADGQLAQLAIQELEQLKQQSQPFFLAVGFFKPHLPFHAPKRYWDLHATSDFSLKDDGQPVVGAPDFAWNTHRELGGYREMPEDERVDAATAAKLRQGYYACVSYVDAQIGKVLDALEQQGLATNTIVILWGDHGWSLGEKARWCKGTNFERDTRIPLLIRVPNGKHSGKSTAALTESVDIYPTLAELAQLPAPAELDGKGLLPILDDPTQPGRDYVLNQFARPFRAKAPQFMGYSIRTKTQRYTRWVTWPTCRTVAEEFYDDTSTASVVQSNGILIEQRNLIDDPNSTPSLIQLRAQLDFALATRIRPRASETDRTDIE